MVGLLLVGLLIRGAFHHVNGNFNLLSNVHHVFDYPIELSNGKKIVSTIQGDVALFQILFFAMCSMSPIYSEI